MILQQLMQPPNANMLASSKASGVNLVEAEILNNLLEDVHGTISGPQISQVLKSVAPFLGSTNASARKNAEALI